MWNDAVGYETYVGHWSRAIAPKFLAWLSLPAKLKWLDVACGTGALSSAILSHADPEEVVGIDSSTGYLEAARRSCPHSRVRFLTGDASALPLPSGSIDAAISGLALNFMDVDRALAEQRRVVRVGGTIAAYVWDYAGGFEFARRFWDAALRVDPRADAYDPGRKAKICRTENLHAALAAAGCAQAETCAFDDTGEFTSRDAYWHAFDARQGTAFEYLSLLSDEQRTRLKDSLLSTMNTVGPVRLKIRALAVKGVRQQV